MIDSCIARTRSSKGFNAMVCGNVLDYELFVAVSLKCFLLVGFPYGVFLFRKKTKKQRLSNSLKCLRLRF